MRDNAIHHLRTAQGVLGLRDKHGCDRLEAACARAARRRRPVLSDHQRHPGRRHRTRRRAGHSGAAAAAGAFLRGPDQFSTGYRHHRLTSHLDNPIPAQTYPSKETHNMSICDPALRNALRTLKLSGMLDTLDARLAQTRYGGLGHLQFLQALCEDEIARRESAALTRRIRRAKFEAQATFESFDFSANPKLPVRCCATWPRCAGSTPANQSSSTARSG